MSSIWKPTRTNKTPWMDKISLIQVVKTTDPDGYVIETETLKPVWCTFTVGMNRTEFYEALKSGLQLSAQAELWANEYGGEKKLVYNNTRYKIIRAFETGRGTIELSLEEELR